MPPYFIKRRSNFSFGLFFLVIFSAFFAVRAQTNQMIYTDSLQNSWQNWSWAQVNLSNSNPAHGGNASISVNADAWEAIYLHHTSFPAANYAALKFWIHGGANGGQILLVNATSNGNSQTAVNLSPLTANAWQEITIPLSAFGFGAGATMDGFVIQDRSGATQSAFYVDDISLTGGTPPPAGAVAIQVDAAANRRPINPLIYGTAYATTAQLLELNAPLNRQGGNNATRYNWQQNADNRANDWYFQSIPFENTPGEVGDTFIQNARGGNAEPMLTVPIIDWIARVGPNREKLASFSINKYGPQTGNDWQWFPDAGNGIRTNGQFVTGNDKTDANLPNSVSFQQGWVQHLINRWGNSANGGLKYYILDNEHSIWFSTHRDVAPTGATMDETFTKMRDYAAMIKNRDSNALVVGPEEWGWGGYLYSGYDQWFAPNNNWTYPDRAAHGNMDYMPWLLQQFKNYETQNGRRILDIFTLHYYPQGGEFTNDVSNAMQLRRNRSTRSLWDASYTDESWINTQVKLIPRMKDWVAEFYPNTKIGLTEYNWGAEGHINGATTQADIYGILGREGMDLATRWTTPETGTPTFKAMKMYRNYDGSNKGFGDTSVAANVPNPDEVSAFASVRTSDNALTVMVINKISTQTSATINLANFTTGGAAQVWQLTSANQISRLADVNVSNNAVTANLPAQSITLFVIGGQQIAAPTNLSGVRAANSIQLNWQDNASDEDGFVIERANGESENFTEVFRVGANQTSFRRNVKFGNYTYRIKTMRGSLLSAPSNAVYLGRE